MNDLDLLLAVLRIRACAVPSFVRNTCQTKTWDPADLVIG